MFADSISSPLPNDQADARATDWRDHCVMVFDGATDSRKGTKRNYLRMSLGEVVAMEHDAQPKDRARAMIPSSYNAPDGRSHEAQRAHGSFVALCLDIDKGSPTLEHVRAMVGEFTGGEVASLIYSTSSASSEQRKWRAVIPLEAPLQYDGWRQVCERLFDFAAARGIEVDRSLSRAGQPVFLPNIPPELRGPDGRPMFAVREFVNGRGLRMTDPGLAQWWAARQAAPESAPATMAAPMKALRTAARRMVPGAIQRFNDAHPLEEMFLECGYTPAPSGGGHWRSPVQASDTFATQIRTGDDGSQYWISLSASDAAAGLGRPTESGARTGDAFDLDVHFRHGGDAAAALAAWLAEEGRQGPQKALEGHPTALDWAALPEHPPEVPFVVPGWLPAGVVTLLAAHGGTGKSYMALYIAICLATGRHPFEKGGVIDRIKVILYSAEDGTVVLQNRIRRYMRMMGVQPSDLADWLEVLDATATDNVLYIPQGPTPRFAWLRERAQQTGAQVLIFDNASDGYGGNEIDRAQVRQFMSALRQVAPTVLLLAHVDAASSMADPADAKGYSGSTAWNNSARSRWFMVRDKSTGEVKLSQQKVNYAAAGAQVIIGWDEAHGVFRVLETLSRARRVDDYRGALLGLLAAAIDAGANVHPAANSPESAFKVLQGLPGFPPHLTSADVGREVSAWLAAQLARREAYTRPNRHTGERLVLTDKGRAAAEAAVRAAAQPGRLQALLTEGALGSSAEPRQATLQRAA